MQRKYDVCPRMAWFMTHRIREAMAERGLVEKMAGLVVADETWIGGKERDKHEWRRTPGLRGGLGKTPVVSLINSHTGEARSAVVPDVTGRTLEAVLRSNVDVGQSVLMTDERRGYRRIGRRCAKHEVVNHGAGQYVRDGASTNVAE